MITVYRPTAPPPPAAEIGGKAHNLAYLSTAGVAVPPWIVIGAAAFQQSVSDVLSWPRTPEEAEAHRTEVQTIEIPDSLRADLTAALRETGLEGELLAVRSSAVGEDGQQSSFAGQFDSVLGVREDGVWDAIRHVWASAFHPHALAYASGERVRMGVVVQAMVNPAVSGVAFGADPVTGRREMTVVSAVYGLGEGLVSGELDADTYRVDFADGQPGTVAATLARKTSAVRLRPDGGTRSEPVPAEFRDAPVLSDGEAREIAACTRRLGEAFGAPQDVEWALEDDGAGGRRLLILQTRPITTLGSAPPEGERRIWDNSNIIESYSGVTSPLTFSFTRGVYEDVYRQFCSLVGVSDGLVDRNRHVFANMLGLVRGRIYYNLLNWYRVLALLPGFSVNRKFMERMMGVREKLDDPPEPELAAGKARDTARLLRMTYRLLRESRRLRMEVPAFHAHVNATLAPLAAEDLTTWSADRLPGLYRRLEEDLLRRWQTPIVNDFFAMIWFGVLGRVVEEWLPDAPPTLVNDLLTHEGGIISTEPARRVMHLAAHVARDPALSELFSSEEDAERLWRRIAEEREYAPLHGEIREYLAEFGDRCMNELKLETITLRDDPAFLLQTIRGYIAAGVVAPADPAREAEVRRAAEAGVRDRLGGLRRRVFRIVLAQTRARVRDRENLRFERTRVFGVVRRIFLGLGHHLAGTGQLDGPRDVFFLTVDEVFSHIHGTATTGDLRGLVGLRRAEWDQYTREPAPPDRFESIGPVALGRWRVPAAAPTDDAGGKVLRGTGCCPGVVRAPIRIVRDPRDAHDLRGHILVAERTDPGWTLLFPAADGLLVERGSLLSHSAIVAREVGLPCVVAIPALLATLRDGEMVEMDGTAGTVRRLDA